MGHHVVPNNNLTGRLPCVVSLFSEFHTKALPMAFRANQQLREDMWDYRRKAAPEAPTKTSWPSANLPPRTNATAPRLCEPGRREFSATWKTRRGKPKSAPRRCAEASPSDCNWPKSSGMLPSARAAKSSRNSTASFRKYRAPAAGAKAYRGGRGPRHRRRVLRAGGRGPALQGQAELAAIEEAIRNGCLDSWFEAFSLREPASTSLENALD